MTSKQELVPSAPILSEGSFYPSTYNTIQLAELYSKPPDDYHKNYKINKVTEIIKYLDTERINRERLKKNYKKADKSLFAVECTTLLTELGLTCAAIFVPPILLINTPICLGLTIFSALTRNCSKMLSKKINKHAEIELLAKSKRNSVDEKYNKAMEDGVISDAEFQDIRKEITNYENMKKEILSKFKNTNSEPNDFTKEVKMTLINKGKEEMKQELKTKLNL